MMPVSVGGVGMVTALGLDWETSCAASRAGVSRSGTLAHFRAQAGDPWEIQFIAGHAATLLTHGFEAKGRILRLLVGALSDLNRKCPQTIGRLPVYLALPDPSARRLSTDTEEWEDEASELLSSGASGPCPQDIEPSELLSAAARLSKWPEALHLAAFSQSGPVGFLELISQYTQEWGNKPALIACVDSLIDASTLNFFHQDNRLKTKDHPTGLVPGEAAVVFLVGGPGVEIGHFNAVTFSQEKPLFSDERGPDGLGINRVIDQIANQTNWPAQESPWILTGNNGEVHHALDWGRAMPRICGKRPAFSEATFWHPASSFGDTAIAQPGVAAASALAALQRGYAPASRCCIVAASDNGARGGLLLSGERKH